MTITIKTKLFNSDPIKSTFYSMTEAQRYMLKVLTSDMLPCLDLEHGSCFKVKTDSIDFEDELVLNTIGEYLCSLTNYFMNNYSPKLVNTQTTIFVKITPSDFDMWNTFANTLYLKVGLTSESELLVYGDKSKIDKFVNLITFYYDAK